MKGRPSLKASRKPFLTAPCFIFSAALFIGALAEAALRWDAMAPPVRIIFRLISTGRLPAGEIIDAVRPEIESGALTYPLCVLVCALCGLWGLGTVLFRRRGFFAAAAYMCAGALAALSGGGTALKTVHLVRCALTFAAAILFAARALTPRRALRSGGCETGSADGGGRAGAARFDHGGPEASPAQGGGRLFGLKRRPLFRDGEERSPLFDHGKGENRHG